MTATAKKATTTKAPAAPRPVQAQAGPAKPIPFDQAPTDVRLGLSVVATNIKRRHDRLPADTDHTPADIADAYGEYLNEADRQCTAAGVDLASWYASAGMDPRKMSKALAEWRRVRDGKQHQENAATNQRLPVVKAPADVRERLRVLTDRIREACRGAVRSEIPEKAGPLIAEARRECDAAGVGYDGWYAECEVGRMTDWFSEAAAFGPIVERFRRSGREQLEAARDGGEILERVKGEFSKRGDWSAWLGRSFPATEQTAGNWRRVARHWAKIQKALDAGKIEPTLREALRLVAKPRKAKPANKVVPITMNLGGDGMARLKLVASASGLREGVYRVVRLLEALGFSESEVKGKLKKLADAK